MDDFAALARLLEALRPWLRHLVIVGGWAHRLHRFHPLANPPAYLSLRTRDADLAFSPTAPTVGDMAAALREAGFHQELSGEEAPPVTQYRLGVEDQDQGFYAEFLTPLRGSGAKRDGSPDATASRAGVTVQKLRFVEILLVHPSHLELGPEVGVPLGTPTEVMVPNPVSFIAQKLLIQTQRRPGKRPQDALYIHDTLDLFGGELDTLRTIWVEHVRATLHPNNAREIEHLSGAYFGTVTDIIRTAVRIPQDRSLTADRMQAA